MSDARPLARLLAEASRRSPTAPAVTAHGVTYSYAELGEAVTRALAHAPDAPSGMAGGLAVAAVLELDDSFESVVSLVAALGTGSVVMLCDREQGDEMRAIASQLAPDVGSEPSVVFPTSGSTGAPKLVCHSQRSLACALESTLELRRQQFGGDLTFTLTVIPGMPLWSISGFNVLELTLSTGGHLVLSGTTAIETLDAIEEHAVTNIGVPPIMLRALVRGQRQRPRRVDSLLLIGIGAGPVDPALAREVETVFGCRVAAAYGSTEVGGAALMPRFDDSLDVRTGSVGRALPGVNIAVDDTGELLVRAASLMRGYIAVDGALVRREPDSWYRTGDLAEIDGDGNAHIVGRVDDQILRGGRLIDPTPIEATIQRHPAVASVAVVGMPSRVPGEQDIWAAYVSAEHTDDSTRAVLQRLCHDVLPPHSRPRRIVRVNEIPLRRDGSPHRPAVRELLLTL